MKILSFLIFTLVAWADITFAQIVIPENWRVQLRRVDGQIVVVPNPPTGGNLATGCNNFDFATHDGATGQQIVVNVAGNTHTWNFQSNGGDAICGQFANGDWWAAPADGQSSVTVTSYVGSGGSAYFVDENPDVNSQGVLPLGSNYSAAENVADDFPKSYSSPISLVAAIQHDVGAGTCWGSAASGNTTCVETYMVLTVLDQPPPGWGKTLLRPPTRPISKIFLDYDTDLTVSRITGLNRNYYTGDDAAGYQTTRLTWSHHIESLSILNTTGELANEGGRAWRARNVVSDIGYSRDVASQWGGDAVTFMTDDNDCSSQDCRQALAAMLSYGFDLYCGVYDCDTISNGTHVRENYFGAGAGQHLGKMAATSFFAATVNSSIYRDSLATQASLVDTVTPSGNAAGPHEMEQANIGPGNVVVWGDTVGDGSHASLVSTDIASYWGNMLTGQCFAGAVGTCDNNGGGGKNKSDPTRQIDGPERQPGTSYMSIASGGSEMLAALMLEIPEVCSAVNYPALITYADRINQVGLWTQPDTCAPPDPTENLVTCEIYPTAAGCEDYGLSNDGTPTWGPTSAAALNTCIANNSGGNTGQTGRFPSLHGTPLSFQGEISEIHNNWNTIRSYIGTNCAGL